MTAGISARRGRRSTAVLALFIAAAAAVPAGAEIDRYLIDTGPLRIRDQFLPGLGYLGFDPVSADILSPGEWQLDFVVTASNSFAHSIEIERALEARPDRSGLGLEELRAIQPDHAGHGLFYLDGEHTRWAVAARRGIGHGLQVEIVVPVIRIDGGFLDSTIEGFHDTFSLGQAGRLGAPRGRFGAYVRSGDQEVYLDRSPGTALGDIVLGVRYDLRRSRPAPKLELAIEGLAKLPTGDVDRLTSSGSADFGAQLLGTRYFRGSCLHFSLGAAYLGPHELYDLDPQTIVSGMLAWEIALGGKTTGLVQATVSQSPFKDLSSAEIRSASTQLTAGVKHAFGRNVLFLGVTENLANFNNSADIGLHIGVTRSIGRH
ncbi:MAG: DUF3187 family protein [Thermoanaerobaculia bacterium]